MPQAVVTPAAAVQRGPQGAQVFVLGQNDTVAVRKVEASQPVGGEVIVRTGLEAGERVVVEGAERLRDGMQVEVKGAAGPKRQGG